MEINQQQGNCENKELTNIKVFTVQVKSRFINNPACFKFVLEFKYLQVLFCSSQEVTTGEIKVALKHFFFHDYKILWKLIFNNSKIVIKAYNMKIKLVEHKQHKIRPTW